MLSWIVGGESNRARGRCSKFLNPIVENASMHVLALCRVVYLGADRNFESLLVSSEHRTEHLGDKHLVELVANNAVAVCNGVYSG